MSNQLNLMIRLTDGAEADTSELAEHVCRQLNDMDDVAAHLERQRGPAGSKGDLGVVGSIVVQLASAGAITAMIELFRGVLLKKEGRTVLMNLKTPKGEMSLQFNPSVTPVSEIERFIATAGQVVSQ